MNHRMKNRQDGGKNTDKSVLGSEILTLGGSAINHKNTLDINYKFCLEMFSQIGSFSEDENEKLFIILQSTHVSVFFLLLEMHI